ncbi:hypothetical protein M896_091690 [Ordospora colligata OC4]|uniref:PH domain-containing protein n=1 Tax=Ordospora colligata OC4 TaxID=1354746 RepID=A0A0B2UDX7_9MICR|nr:uncharacterized protein M896_091690 [Ordospora colligata OC4]KHN69241.1 hypothetical protein M896_091690 [Ordospora colligata OC4]TBU14519.1 hypothetical protein CWI40_091650 [Ordospora colligata]TBU14696.1 hypothetical protein CWI41_091680 [Ordospora colligata]
MEKETDGLNGTSISSEDILMDILGYYDEVSEDCCVEKEISECHSTECQNDNDYAEDVYSDDEQEYTICDLDSYAVNADMDYAEYNCTEDVSHNGPDERMNQNDDLNINEFYLVQERLKCAPLACLYDDSETYCERSTNHNANELSVKTSSLDDQPGSTACIISDIDDQHEHTEFTVNESTKCTSNESIACTINENTSDNQYEPIEYTINESLDDQCESTECTINEHALERVSTDIQGMSEKEAELRDQVVEIFCSTPKIDANNILFDRMTVNRICIDEAIFVSADEYENTNAQRKTKKDHSINNDDTKCTDSRMYSFSKEDALTSELNTDVTMDEETMKVFKEMEKRTSEVDSSCASVSGDVPRQKFVIDQEEVFLKIEDVIRLNDLKHRNLIGKMHKKGRNGRYQYNWFTLRKNFFTCYSRKGWRMVPGALLENDGNLKDPEQDMFFLKRKYTLDLLCTKIYLLNKKKWYGCISANSWTEDGLIDITEDTKIMKIVPVKRHFVVVLKKNLVKTEIHMKELSFMLKNGDATYFYKSKCIDTFLSWIIAFAFRQGRIACNIG